MKGIFESPNAYIKSINWNSNEVCIVPMSRESYLESNFLDKRVVSTGREKWIKLEELVMEFNQAEYRFKPIHYIFHTAFCGSTLLSRCLEETGRFISFREPLILHQLAFAIRKKTLPFNDHERKSFVEMMLAQFGRTYHTDENPIVKPSDSCINLAVELLSLQPKSTALFLYMPLPDFVVAMLKIPSRRTFIRKMLDRAKLDLKSHGISIAEKDYKDDEVAAIVWLGLIIPYLKMHRDRLNIKSLDASIFYQTPESTLMAIGKWFGQSIPKNKLSEIVNNGAFTRQSKNTSSKYDRERKLKERETYRQMLSSEIESAKAFIDSLNLNQSIPSQLPGSLMIQADLCQ